MFAFLVCSQLNRKSVYTMPVDTSYLLLFLSQSKDPSARTPQHRAESCQASTWRLDLISHMLSNYVLHEKDVTSLPTFGVQMKTAQASPHRRCRYFLTNAERGLKSQEMSRDIQVWVNHASQLSSSSLTLRFNIQILFQSNPLIMEAYTIGILS